MIIQKYTLFINTTADKWRKVDQIMGITRSRDFFFNDGTMVSFFNCLNFVVMVHLFLHHVKKIKSACSCTTVKVDDEIILLVVDGPENSYNGIFIAISQIKFLEN